MASTEGRLSRLPRPLLDDARVVAHGRAIPLAWTPDDDALPDEGWDFALERGMRDHEAGRRPTVAAASWIVVATDRQGEGLSVRMVRMLRDVCACHGLSALLAPVRPTLKGRYPLIPMSDDVTWTNAAPEPFDPWPRVHYRLGGRVLGVCARSMTITGSIDEWQRAASLAMPASGRYVVDGALAPVDIDHQTGIGTYIEPNVWMRHTIDVEG